MSNDEFNDIELTNEEDKCSGCRRKAPETVSFFMHENSIMHKDMDNERAHRTNLFVCLTVIILTLIFVCAYTFRMNAFIELIREMNAEIIKLASAKGIITP